MPRQSRRHTPPRSKVRRQRPGFRGAEHGPQQACPQKNFPELKSPVFFGVPPALSEPQSPQKSRGWAGSRPRAPSRRATPGALEPMKCGRDCRSAPKLREGPKNERRGACGPTSSGGADESRSLGISLVHVWEWLRNDVARILKRRALKLKRPFSIQKALH